LLQKREMKNPKPNEQASTHGRLTAPGKLDCIPISLPNPGEEQRGGFPKSRALSYYRITAAKTRLIRTKNQRQALPSGTLWELGFLWQLYREYVLRLQLLGNASEGVFHLD